MVSAPPPVKAKPFAPATGAEIVATFPFVGTLIVGVVPLSVSVPPVLSIVTETSLNVSPLADSASATWTV